MAKDTPFTKEDFEAMGPRQKGFAVYWFGANPAQPNIPETYTPKPEEKAEYDRGQFEAVLAAQDSED